MPGRAARVLTTIAVMSATVMQVLDTTIVNVALPQMQGQLGATPDQISWVLTSYLVASAIFMPLTGFFSDRLGRRRYLLASIFGFVVASMLCGLATSVTQLVAFRLLQGVFGAALVPLSQAILIDTYPPEERGHAMALWGLGVMVGPVVGPTLGGWLTETLSWRWTFYINLPVGVMSLLLAARFVPDTPTAERRMDWTGFGLLACAIGGLQFALDRGNHDDWFDSRAIVVATGIAAVGFAGFLLHATTTRDKPLFSLALFADRNFASACLVKLAIGLGLYGALMLQPFLMQTLLGYPVLTAGMLMMPRGIATAISMLVAGRLLRTIDPRLLIVAGAAMGGAASFAMSRYTLEIGIESLIWPIFVQGLGLGLIVVPLTTMAFSTLPRARLPEAAGLFSLVRTVGASIGVSIVTTVLARQSQANWNQLGGHVTRGSPALADYLRPLGLTPDDPRAIRLLADEVWRQATMIALLDAFLLIAWSFALMVPLILALRRRVEPAGT